MTKNKSFDNFVGSNYFLVVRETRQNFPSSPQVSKGWEPLPYIYVCFYGCKLCMFWENVSVHEWEYVNLYACNWTTFSTQNWNTCIISSRTHTLTHLILYLHTLPLNDTRLNSYSASSDHRTWTFYGLSSGQPLWFDAALVNKLMPCAWLSSGDLEVWRLRLHASSQGCEKCTSDEQGHPSP